MPSDLVERLARAWASIDGSAKRFERGRSGSDSEGTYEGYMIEAEELLKRSGLADHFTALQARNARLGEALRSAIENCDNCGGTGVRCLYSVDPENGTSREIRVKCPECSAFSAALSDETPDTPQDTEDKGHRK